MARARGRARARFLGFRFGNALHEARDGAGLTQRQASDRAGISQPLWSRLERGFAAAASIETLATAAAAVGMELAAFIQDAPGADLPRDIEHVRRQELVIRLARRGEWLSLPEQPIDLADKVAAVVRQHPGWIVAGLVLVRATRRNRDLIAELGATFDARFPALSREWLRALEDPAVALPRADGFAWTSVRGDRLVARGR